MSGHLQCILRHGSHFKTAHPRLQLNPSKCISWKWNEMTSRLKIIWKRKDISKLFTSGEKFGYISINNDFWNKLNYWNWNENLKVI